MLYRGGAKACSRLHGDTFSLGCLLRYDDSIDLKYEITINVRNRAIVENETLTEISYKTLQKKESIKKSEKVIFSTKPSPLDSDDIAVSINNGLKGRNPDVNCIKYYASTGQIASKLSTDTKYGRTTVYYCNHD